MLEYQRYGRNKKTTINSTYINSGEYRRKFDKITNNDKVNHILYVKAKEMLFHRSGTLWEDMYWIDGETGEIVASALNEQIEKGIEYTDSISRKLRERNNLITMHTHPNSMPPSIADFNSCFAHNYDACYVICHDGIVYNYVSNQEVPADLYELYVQKFIEHGYNDKDAQINALEKIKKNYDIDFQEVK